jgi:N-acetylglutamate synthase-like GNAT family acetyltransferase
MTALNHRVRRATLDDLPALQALWKSMHFKLDELEKRLTEFQVVESAGGQIAGALGVEILRQHAWLHSEAYQDYALADDVRPLLVERIQSLASNHGVFRLWTREKSPFWSRCGFRPATPELLRKLPEKWAGAGSDWFTLQLKDEEAIVSLEKELTLLMETEKQRTARTIQHVRTLKSVALWLSVVLGMFVVGAAIYLLLKNPGTAIPRK